MFERQAVLGLYTKGPSKLHTRWCLTFVRPTKISQARRGMILGGLRRVSGLKMARPLITFFTRVASRTPGLGDYSELQQMTLFKNGPVVSIPAGAARTQTRTAPDPQDPFIRISVGGKRLTSSRHQAAPKNGIALIWLSAPDGSWAMA